MIPPEPGPGPDPPLPDVPEYTYASSSPVTLGSVTGTLYTAIQRNGNECILKGVSEVSSTVHNYKNLILYDDVLGDPQCYFATGSSSVIRGVLGSNAAVGSTVPTYLIQSGQVTQSDSDYLESVTPSDYFTNVVNRNFTLVQRS